MTDRRRFPPPSTVDKTEACFMVRIRNALLTKAAQRAPGGHRHWETSMSIESLTYAELGDRLGASPEAARSLARRLRLTRRPGNDGKVRVTVDLAEIQYKPLPVRSPGGHRTEIDGLNARIEQLQAELARLEVEKRCLEACAAGHRADFEHERKRLDTLMTETRRWPTLPCRLVKKRRDWKVSCRRPGPVAVGGVGLSLHAWHRRAETAQCSWAYP